MPETSTHDSSTLGVPLVLLFSSDLMLISSVGGAAAAADLRFCSVARITELAERVAADQIILCLDLSAPESDPGLIGESIPASVLQYSIAFGPHVHTGKLEQARSAGFARVMSRGQFVSKMRDELSAAAKFLRHES